MTSAQPRVGEQRPGGRAARVRTAILEATSDVLSEVGYEQLSVEEIASRAGVHKTTVYRRWPSKADLVFAAVGAHSEVNVPIPDTGNFLGDLQALAHEVIGNIGSAAGSRRSRSIVAAAATSRELAAGMHAFWAQRLAASAPVVERAIERGEIPSVSDPNLIIETLIGPIWIRLLLTGEPLSDEFADRVAELVAAGAADADDRG